MRLSGDDFVKLHKMAMEERKERIVANSGEEVETIVEITAKLKTTSQVRGKILSHSNIFK